MTAETLALLGGAPVRSAPLPPYNTIGEDEKKAVMEVLDSGELSGFVAGPIDQFYGGKTVKGLEQDFKDYFGVKHALGFNSATSGLHAAVYALDIGPGDEVITSPYTMSASATCILMCGAVPIFADIDPDTFTITPESVEANITENTKAIVAVNIFGLPADLDALRAIADKHGIYLIEDNAQAPDADYHGRKTSTVGHAGVYSFNRHKTMQCGEGGVLVTNDDKLALKAAMLRNHGEVVVKGMGVTDIVNTMGVNYRMTEMEAAVARVQFAKMKELNAIRVKLADRLTERLNKIDGITPPHIPEGLSHVYYFYVMKYDEDVVGIPRDLFAEAVQAEGFTMRGGYVRLVYNEPLFQQKICLGKDGFPSSKVEPAALSPFTANSRNDEIVYHEGLCPVAEKLQSSGILLTNIIYPPLTLEDMDAFCDAIEKVIANKDALLAGAELKMVS